MGRMTDDEAAPPLPVVASVGRWEWDRAAAEVSRVVGRAKFVTWLSAAAIAVVLAALGCVLTTGILRESSLIYGALAGVAGGFVVRAVYVGTQVRRAVAPVKAAVVPRAVDRASEAQLVSLLVNGGAMFAPYVLLRARPGDATVEITRSDLTEGPFPRPGFWQLMMTGPDGSYYDDGSGTMDGAATTAGGDVGGGFGGDFGGDFGGGGSGS
ncbi:MAG: hypothetical protein JWQ91_1551 [Aeromicrobium sp.]|nr:hypothetical protein [Aeromicrobium sp.]